MNKQPYIAESLAVLEQAHIILTEAEQQHIEIAHFNLPDYPRSGLQLLTYCNSPLYCAKELVLFADQTCPEHRHPPYKDRRVSRKLSAAAGARCICLWMILR